MCFLLSTLHPQARCNSLEKRLSALSLDTGNRTGSGFRLLFSLLELKKVPILTDCTACPLQMFTSLQISVPALSCVVCSGEMAKCCAMPASTAWKVSDPISSKDSAPWLQGDFGKPFGLTLRKTEIDLSIQRILVPMVTKPGKKFNNVNGNIQNWVYQSSWSELPPLPQNDLPRSTPYLPICTAVKHPSESGYSVIQTNWGMCWLTNLIVHGTLL